MNLIKKYKSQFFSLCTFASLCIAGSFNIATAQTGLVNTQASPYALLTSVGINDVKFTTGFWADRLNVCQKTMVPQLWNTYTSKDMCYAFQNFKIAAGIDTGRFRGPSFHDGDFYKTLEAMAALYAYNKDAHIDSLLDYAIAVIAKAQKADGYIYTKSIIEQQKNGGTKMFDDKLSFEAYNLGHLMTAACVHYRATGKKTLLNIAIKATNFLINFYNNATPEQARNAICPSHYMGIAEMYRTTADTNYKNLLTKLIDIRGTSEGTDDNSDKIPFRQMKTVNGHAVRANYLFAGVADLYAENGDATLLNTLNLMWDDVANHKMYITGGCGALYDGLALEGLSYKPDSIQKIQQAYGKAYQLPNKTAHNETCANIGNLLWNWRMFLLTMDRKYIDLVELELYNAVLSGISLDGDKFFYTNPLSASKDFPYYLRWNGGRQKYISKSNCCPPNVVRTIAEVNNYMYSIGENGLYVNLYGSNTLNTELHTGEKVVLEQTTNYPWDGKIKFTIKEKIKNPIKIFLRIPAWCKKYNVKVKNETRTNALLSTDYIMITEKWNVGETFELNLDMPVMLMESNPLVEETKNQVAIKRGPIVYCIESNDISKTQNVLDVVIPANIKLQPKPYIIANTQVMRLEGEAVVLKSKSITNTLYNELNLKTEPIKISLIPYYAWSNRGKTDMTVWMNLMR